MKIRFLDLRLMIKLPFFTTTNLTALQLTRAGRSACSPLSDTCEIAQFETPEEIGLSIKVIYLFAIQTDGMTDHATMSPLTTNKKDAK